jgi:phosphatidylserine/phosphatidylglycerophosphate/cardiolipin synthase-like enzyme
MKTVYASILVFLMAAGHASAATVQVFSSPDNSFSVLSGFLSEANSSVYLASYTFDSLEVADLLSAAADRGVEVIVMVEGGPAGGISGQESAVLCGLTGKGITIRSYKGPAPYMHAKYIVRDNSSLLISTENFGPAGFSYNPGYGNRGWGAVTDWGAAEFLRTYFSDIALTVVFPCPANSTPLYDRHAAGRAGLAESASFSGQQVSTFFSPDGSMDAILGLIASAGRSVYIEQLYARRLWKDGKESPLLAAVIERARKGLEVKILLDSTYYNVNPENKDNNNATVEYINGIAAAEGLDMEARLANLAGNGLKLVHVKGVVVDGSAVIISSVNWNYNSALRNREAGLVIHGNAAKYYEALFLRDWGGKSGPEAEDEFPALMALGFFLCLMVVAAFLAVLLR